MSTNYLVTTIDGTQPQLKPQYTPKTITKTQPGEFKVVFGERIQATTGKRIFKNAKKIKKIKKEKSSENSSEDSNFPSALLDSTLQEQTPTEMRKKILKRLLRGGYEEDMLNDIFELRWELPQMEEIMRFCQRHQKKHKRVNRLIDLNGLLINPDNKKTHLYIQGPSNSGKTYWVEKTLKNYIKAPRNNDWSQYQDDVDFIVFDEFAPNSLGPFTKENLFELMDGKTQLNTKGGSKIVVNKPILIFCSQYSMEAMFSNESLLAFRNRTRNLKMENRILMEVFN